MAVEVRVPTCRGAPVVAVLTGNHSLRLQPGFGQVRHAKLFRLTDQAAQATLSVSDSPL